MTEASYEICLPFADYRAWKAVSSSDLRAMRAGPPAMVPWRRETPSPETDATRLGTAAHCAILEPERFEERYVMKPEGMTFASTEGKAWRAAHADKIILTHDEWVTVDEIVDAFFAKPCAAEALRSATMREASIRWTDEATGLACKARPDWFVDGEYVYDLKISRHAASSGLGFRAKAEGWIHQLAFYRDAIRAVGMRVEGARLVVIGPSEPQALRVYTIQIKADDLGLAALENESTMKQIAECEASGVWPGTPDSWELVNVPASLDDGILWDDGNGNELAPLTGGG